jgi:hypothetical protein
MRLLVNAIITGFGLKLGNDLYKFVKRKLGLPEYDDNNKLVPTDTEAQS